MRYRINQIDKLVGTQAIIHLEDEDTGETGPDGDSEWVVRVPFTEIPSLIMKLTEIYRDLAQGLAYDLAAGECRACKGSYRRGPDGKPCPSCESRAERRLTERVLVPRGKR